VVTHVLDGEQIDDASITVTFVSTARMRALNRASLGRDRSTDVIAFGMRHDHRLIGDVYVCAGAARAAARKHGISPREELLRLVVHGTLHAAGRDHPRSASARLGSAMWRDQEGYLRHLLDGAGRGRG
jgi:probable rRNA maturation factor